MRRTRVWFLICFHIIASYSESAKLYQQEENSIRVSKLQISNKTLTKSCQATKTLGRMSKYEIKTHLSCKVRFEIAAISPEKHRISNFDKFHFPGIQISLNLSEVHDSINTGRVTNNVQFRIKGEQCLPWNKGLREAPTLAANIVVVPPETKSGEGSLTPMKHFLMSLISWACNRLLTINLNTN